MTDEQLDLYIDLKPILRWWREIIALTLLCVLAAGVVSRLMTPMYEAQARVLLLRRRTDVNLDSRLEIVSEDGQVNSRTRTPATYMELVTSPAIAERVIEELSGTWLSDINPSKLLSKVEAENVQNSDVLAVKVTDPDPARAAVIASAWAEVYVDYVNRLYSEPYADYQTVVGEVEKARTQYEAAQTALEAYIADDRMTELEGLIAEKTALIARLETDKQTALTTLVDPSGQGSVLSIYVDAALARRVFRPDVGEVGFPQNPGMVSESPVGLDSSNAAMPVPSGFSLALEGHLSNLGRDYRLAEQYRRQLGDVQALQQHLVEGGDPATTALAIALLKAQLLDVERGVPAELALELPPSAVDGGDAVTDLQALETSLLTAIDVVEERIEEERAALSSAVYGADVLQGADDPVSAQLSALYAEVRTLTAEMETQASGKRKLELTRDVAWESYNTLARKEAELRIASELPATEVRFVAPAATPNSPVSPRTLVNIAIAGAAGFAVAVAGAFLLASLDYEPFFARREGRVPDTL